MTIRMGGSHLAFSSSWLGGEGGRAREVARAASMLGLFQVEMGPHLDADPPDRISSLFRAEKITVAAVHHALPTGGGAAEALEADALADPRPAEAERSIALTRETAGAARILGADKVILHLGTLRNDELQRIHEEVSDLVRREGMTKEASTLLDKGRAIATRRQEAWLDRAIRVLFHLLKSEPEITFCIENRYAFHELPDLQGLGYLFEDLRSPRLKYWHNTGAAEVQEFLGLTEEGAWLGEFGDRTAGVHLHDAAGLDIHLPPGCGGVDFKGVLEALPSEALRVITLKPASTREEFDLGIKELKRMGF